MSGKLLPALFAIALAGTAAGDVRAQVKVSGDVVRVGVLTDLSGIYSNLAGEASVIAARMAIDDFIAGHKPSFRIDLVSGDHGNKAHVGAKMAAEWYDIEGVDMVTDVVNSNVALAISKVTEEHNRILIVTASATTRLTNEDCSPNTIHYVYDTYALANGPGRAVTKAGGDTWFFVTVDYAFGHSLESDTGEAVKAAGGKVLGAVRHPLNAGDFSAYLQQAQASKAKVVGLANAGSDAVNSILAAKELGLTKRQTVVGLLTTIVDIHTLGLAATQGMMFTDGFYWNLNDDTRAWSQRFFEKYGKMPNMVVAGNYSAVMHYLKAVEAAGSDEPGAVLKKMKEMPIDDFFARNGRIREDGRMLHDMYLVQVKRPAESKAPWDYYHIKAVIPAEQAFQPLAASRCPLVKH